MSILELLKRRTPKPPTKHYKTLQNGVVDLTSCSDTDDEAIDDCMAADTEEAVDVVEIEGLEVVSELTTGMKNDEVGCPVCLVDLSRLTLEDRESHVELCLLKPSSSSFALPKSPKKIQTQKKKANLLKSDSTDPSPKPPKQRKRTRPLPDFKIITLDPYKLIVDGFSYADGPTDLYFLSHFHSDHYGGLFKSWCQGMLYCSEITANLAMNMFKIPSEQFIILPMDEKFEIRPGLFVTLYDANHCPGAVIFLFETEQKKVLHTGDFRVSQGMIDLFKDVYIDQIYLDTTYLNPTYTFYDQRLVINSTVQFITDTVLSAKKRKRGILDFMTGDVGGYVILVGSYSIGKEKIYLDIARALKTKIFVTERRYKTLQLSGMGMEIFDYKDDSGCMMYVVNFEKLGDKAWLKKFSNRNIIKVRPSGWTHSRLKKVEVSFDMQDPKGPHQDYYQSTISKVCSTGVPREVFEDQLKVQLERGNTLSVPYSEHSSFKELSMFGSLLKWGEMIPTVSVENPEFPHWFKAWKGMEIPYSVVENHYTRDNA